MFWDNPHVATCATVRCIRCNAIASAGQTHCRCGKKLPR